MKCPVCSWEKQFEKVAAYETSFREMTLSHEVYLCPHCLVEFCHPMAAAPEGWYEEVQSYPWRWEFSKVAGELGSPPKRILEFGCGPGDLLFELTRIGHSVFGIEINERVLAEARMRGLEVLHVQPEDYSSHFPPISFDVILFFHVLEHVEDPIRFLRSAWRLLRDDGLIVFSVPNPRNVNRLLGFYPSYARPPHHLIRNFSEKGLEIAMEASGFSPLKIEDQPIPGPFATFRDAVGVYYDDAGIRVASRFLRGIAKVPAAFYAPIFVARYLRIRKRATGNAIYIVARKVAEVPKSVELRD